MGPVENLPELNERERSMLDFERRWWTQRSNKAERIRQEFGVPPVRYFQQLNALIERPEALDYDPVTVRMLLRRRGDES